MRKYILVIFLICLLFLFGCASMQSAFDDYGYISNSSAIELDNVKNNVGGFVSLLVGMLPRLKDSAPAIGAFVGVIASFFYGVFLGKKKKRG